MVVSIANATLIGVYDYKRVLVHYGVNKTFTGVDETRFGFVNPKVEPINITYPIEPMVPVLRFTVVGVKSGKVVEVETDIVNTPLVTDRNLLVDTRLRLPVSISATIPVWVGPPDSREAHELCISVDPVVPHQQLLGRVIQVHATSKVRSASKEHSAVKTIYSSWDAGSDMLSVDEAMKLKF